MTGPMPPQPPRQQFPPPPNQGQPGFTDPHHNQPPGWLPGPAAGPPPQYPYAPASRPPRAGSAIWLLATVSVVGVVLGLSLSENGRTAWPSVHAWGAVAIVAAALTAAPVAGAGFGVTAQMAVQLSAVAAGTLVLYWVLFVLPAVGSNTSLLMTVGVAAGAGAARSALRKQSVDGNWG